MNKRITIATVVLIGICAGSIYLGRTMPTNNDYIGIMRTGENGCIVPTYWPVSTDGTGQLLVGRRPDSGHCELCIVRRVIAMDGGGKDAVDGVPWKVIKPVIEKVNASLPIVTVAKNRDALVRPPKS